MRIVLKVSSSNEYCNGGCEFALLDLTPELASVWPWDGSPHSENRRTSTRTSMKSITGHISWSISLLGKILPAPERKSKARVTLEGMLDELSIEEKEIRLCS